MLARCLPTDMRFTGQIIGVTIGLLILDYLGYIQLSPC